MALPVVDAGLTGRLLDKTAGFDEMRARVGASLGEALKALQSEHRPEVTDALANKLMDIARVYECAPDDQREHALGGVLIALGGFLGAAWAVKPQDMPEYAEGICETIQYLRVSFRDSVPSSESLRRTS